jgi:hypothetical protein
MDSGFMIRFGILGCLLISVALSTHRRWNSQRYRNQRRTRRAQTTVRTTSEIITRLRGTSLDASAFRWRGVRTSRTVHVFDFSDARVDWGAAIRAAGLLR